MIRVFNFEPKFFNNNGDQGSIEVLTVLLQRQGAAIQFVDSLDDADFALFGDASIATMEHFRDRLAKFSSSLLDRHAAGAPTLLVGSCYEHFAQQLGLPLRPMERQSDFEESAGVFGYRNSVLDLPSFYENGLFWGTQLFGPLLAKNPQLTARLMSHFGYEAAYTAQELSWVDEIRRRAIGG